MRNYFIAAGYLFVLLLSSSLLGYGWMMRQFETAQQAARRGDDARALELYRRAERPFHKLPWLTHLLSAEYAQVNLNQVAILYQQKQYEAAVEKLERLAMQLPARADSGDYRFWMGNLLFRRAAQSADPKASLEVLKAALSEYQKGLVAQPDDWDLKFDYELLRSILAKRGRNQAKQAEEVKSIIDKMRLQEPMPQQLAPERRG